MPQETTNQALIRLPQVSLKTGLGRSAIYARLKPNPNRPADFDATFPRPVAIGARAVAWVESEIDAWIAARIAAAREVKA